MIWQDLTICVAFVSVFLIYMLNKVKTKTFFEVFMTVMCILWLSVITVKVWTAEVYCRSNDCEAQIRGVDLNE
jgi:hypothetical protein